MFGFRIVPQGYAIVVERLGKFNRVLYSGLRFVFPIIERTRPIFFRALEVDVTGVRQVVTKMSEMVDLREQVLDFPKQSVITKDNVMMEIDAVLYYQVVDPERAVYGIANLVDGIEKLVQTTLRNVVGQLSLDETLASRETINAQLRAVLDETTPNWGVRVSRVELQEISPPEDIRRRMELQMTAEREKRAAILKAEGEKQAAILESEGEASAEIRRAEAVKQAEILRAEGMARVREVTCESCDVHIDGVWTHLKAGQKYKTPSDGCSFEVSDVGSSAIKISLQKRTIKIKREAFSAALHYLRENRHDEGNPCPIRSSNNPEDAGPLCRAARASNDNVRCIN